MKKNAVFTHQAALTQWCPRAQVSASPTGDIVTNMPNNSAVTCAGPLCMAWRWHTTHIKNPEAQPGENDLIESSNTYGYCGMAGAP